MLVYYLRGNYKNSILCVGVIIVFKKKIVRESGKIFLMWRIVRMIKKVEKK